MSGGAWSVGSWSLLLRGVVVVFFWVFELLLFFIAAQVVHEVVGTAADGAEQVGYAAGAQDEEDRDDDENLYKA